MNKVVGCCCCSCCSVAKPRLTLWDHVDYSTPGLSAPHHLLKFTQVHVHWIGDSLQLSHPLSPSLLLRCLLLSSPVAGYRLPNALMAFDRWALSIHSFNSDWIFNQTVAIMWIQYAECSLHLASKKVQIFWYLSFQPPSLTKIMCMESSWLHVRFSDSLIHSSEWFEILGPYLSQYDYFLLFSIIVTIRKRVSEETIVIFFLPEFCFLCFVRMYSVFLLFFHFVLFKSFILLAVGQNTLYHI